MLSSASRFASKVLLFNASPRTNCNTMKLLKETKKGAESVGADVEIVNLYKLKMKGCGSCLLCKKDGAPAKCYLKDDLTKYLEKIHNCTGFAVGSPVYMSNLSSSFYQFYERLIYSNTRYENGPRRLKLSKKINTGLIITQGADNQVFEGVYKKKFGDVIQYLGTPFNTKCELVANVQQALIPDKTGYEMGIFDMEKIHAWVKEHDPIVLKQAFDLGVKLATE